MFEVNVFTPAQFGAFIAWLVINRGPLSVLVHPNTGEDEVSITCVTPAASGRIQEKIIDSANSRGIIPKERRGWGNGYLWI